MTNGSSKIHQCTAKISHLAHRDSTHKEIDFTCDQGSEIIDANKNPIINLNELEWKGGYLWINRYLTTDVIVVNAAIMKVVQTWDMAELEKLADNRMQANFKRALMTGDEVLNGLTWNLQKQVWLMTGKNWDVIFEIQLDTS